MTNNNFTDIFNDDLNATTEFTNNNNSFPNSINSINSINSTNLTNLTNANATNSTDLETGELSWVYTQGVPIITVFCIISMTVNVRVLISVRWIKGPLSTTLFISLSLAAADAFASALFFIGFVLNSYTSRVWNFQFPDCFSLVLEAFRLGAIVTTVMHLTFLAINHYLGIVRPLHYPNIMTRELTKGLLVILWILPPIYFLIYFSCITDDGFQNNCESNFIQKITFRIMFTLFLLIPLIAMTFIYTHILIIVRRKQNEWNFLARREASYKHKGGMRNHGGNEKRKTHRNMTQHSHDGRHGVGNDQRSQQRMQHNVKAVHTTLLILGSFVAGLLPAIILYLLFCEDCLYRAKDVHSTFYWLVNLLLVTKPLANPIIYAARMQEIKKATRRMRVALCHGNGKCRFCSPLLPICWLCCGCSRNSANNRMNGAGSRLFSRRWGGGGGGNNGPGGYGIDSGVDSQQLYVSGSSYRAQTPRTAVCRLVSNGNTPHLSTFGHISGNNTVTFASDVGQKSHQKNCNHGGDSTTVL